MLLGILKTSSSFSNKEFCGQSGRDFHLDKDAMEDKTSLDDTENVIVLQDVDGPFQGLKPVAPGVPSAESPLNARNTFLLQNKSVEQTGQSFVFVQDSPSRAPRSSHDFSCELSSRLNETSGFLQQQLLNTQQMCLQQQKAMTALTETVSKLQKSLNVREHSRSSKRKLHSPQLRSRRTSHQLSDISESSSEYENFSEDESTLSRKRMRMQSEEEGEISEENSTEKISDSGLKLSEGNSKIDKLKKLNSSFVKERKFSESVHEVVASTVNQGLEAPVDHKTEHVQTLLKKYDRPSNCTFLEVPKVNKSVWVSKHTSKGIKESDRIMQRTQTYLTKGLIPLVKIMDKTLQSDSGESEELFDLAMDSFNLLAFSHRDLSSQRRRLLAPAIANKYKQLCSETAPISPLHLFGEEESLEKQVKEIDDSRKLGSKINFLNMQSSTSQQRDKTGATFNRTGGYRQYKPQFKSSHSSDKRPFKQHFLPKRAQNQQTTKNQYKKAELGHQRK